MRVYSKEIEQDNHLFHILMDPFKDLEPFNLTLDVAANEYEFPMGYRFDFKNKEHKKSSKIIDDIESRLKTAKIEYAFVNMTGPYDDECHIIIDLPYTFSKREWLRKLMKLCEES